MIPVNEMGQSSIKNIARTYSKHFGTKNMLFFGHLRMHAHVRFGDNQVSIV